MNAPGLPSISGECGHTLFRQGGWAGRRFSARSLEAACWAAVLVAVNAGLFLGRPPAWALALDLSAVFSGAWWRVLTYPLVHVSPYHLLLDGVSFVMLYAMLENRSTGQRLGIVGACSAGGLVLSWPGLASTGLCGLSGVGHGLMAVVALDQTTSADAMDRRIGWACFLGVAAKSLFEAITGQVVFSGLHLGDVGHPVAICHLGGVAGGLSAWLCSARIFHKHLVATLRRELNRKTTP